MIKEINFSKKAVEKINQLISGKPSGTFFRIAVKKIKVFFQFSKLRLWHKKNCHLNLTLGCLIICSVKLCLFWWGVRTAEITVMV